MRQLIRELILIVRQIHCAFVGHKWQPLKGTGGMSECTRCDLVDF